jgi:hypothetical protein
MSQLRGHGLSMLQQEGKKGFQEAATKREERARAMALSP